MSPNDRRYTKSHEWIKIEDDEAIIGVTDYAQDAMGDVTFVELPSVGTELVQEEECGVIESVKAASDLYSPVSGTVSEVNHQLEDSPELINQDPYEDGWIMKLRNFSASELKGLMDAETYEGSLDEDS